MKTAMAFLVGRTVPIGCCSVFLSSLILVQAEPGKTFFNVRDFGAVGDGKNLDSTAINNTIEAAAAAGGGTVLVPAGTYLSGSIHLQSNFHRERRSNKTRHDSNTSTKFSAADRRVKLILRLLCRSAQGELGDAAD
jgi:hypothetical protein